ncbi:MAG TPA: DUF1134 domain-containing protein [Afifellaceae bacterium]|nr:DUF1134 domain-containing protein [Afifellaceae bacterium]
MRFSRGFAAAVIEGRVEMWLRGKAPLVAGALLAAVLALSSPGTAAPGGPSADSSEFSSGEVVAAGHRFFGVMSGELAALVERIVDNYGLPNGYIIGQEASGALIGGLRYGQGTLYTRDAGSHPIFWQGPSIGWDVGGDGDRTMMLVYDLPAVESIYRRFAGVNGSAYLVGGLGMTVLANTDFPRPVYIVPIRSGLGARLGINIGYLKFTDQRTWNPF